MSEKTLKFNNIILNKKIYLKDHRPKELIDLLSVDLNIMTNALSILLVT